ncbi:MAG TPA: sulfite exporter TauE/SafE family protein [Chitinophagaceae bacterium]|nr:sulfite exporter TauE/SafE family protein [Chitinophagaceae bacterium]
MMTHLAGYFFCIFIGFSLGLIGGGGSILTIPMLVFFFGIDPVMATTYSLFIVGLTAVSGSIDHYRVRNIDYKTVLLFGIPSVIVLFIMRRWLLGLIPPTILTVRSLVLSKSLFIMIIFSITMLVAGGSMVRKKGFTHSPEKLSYARLVLQGCITGAITGFIGIGGGFIIVPSLVLFAGLPMKRAIGTSLVIITINCLVGILGNLEAVESLNFILLSALAALAIIGILIGTWSIRFIPDKQLKPIFGWIILVLSAVIFVRIFLEHLYR